MVGDDDLPHLKKLYFYNGNSVVNKLSCCNLRLRQTFYCQQSQETVQYELKESNAMKQLQNEVSNASTCIRYNVIVTKAVTKTSASYSVFIPCNCSLPALCLNVKYEYVNNDD